MAGASVGSNASISKLRWIGLCLLERRRRRVIWLCLNTAFLQLQLLDFVAVNPGTLLIQISEFPILKITEYLRISFLYTTSFASCFLCLRQTNSSYISDLPWALASYINKCLQRGLHHFHMTLGSDILSWIDLGYSYSLRV